MQYIKLQFGCLILCLWFHWMYQKDVRQNNVKSNIFYRIIVIVAPLSIIFDGATAYTVNYLDTVPLWLNNLLHCLFITSMNLQMFLIFLYVLSITTGLPKRRVQKILAYVPFIISMIIMVGTLPDLEYLEGTITNYSMGISVIAGYITMFLYFVLAFILINAKRRTIKQKKYISILVFFIICFGIIIFQCIYPEALLTAILPTVMTLGLYVSVEDPNLIQLEEYNRETISCFANLIENRDNSTGGHIKRTRAYVEVILDEMKKNGIYNDLLSKDYKENVLNGAPMHDIGKIATPDYILKKPSSLTNEEFSIMKTHALDGANMITDTFSNLYDKDFVTIAYDMAKCHHERWDGTGYPFGLKGEEIPVHARIVAIADVFDAVAEDRCYRAAMPIDECFKIIEEGAGKAFDPVLTRLFLNRKSDIIKIQKEI